MIIPDATSIVAQGYEWPHGDVVIEPEFVELLTNHRPALVPQRKPLAVPDISKGIGKNQENTDLRELENFAIADNDICIFDGVAFVYNGIFWEEQGKYGVIRHLRKKFQKVNIDCRLSMKEYSDISQMLLANPDIQREQFFTPEHSVNLHKVYELFAYDEGFESLSKIVFGRALADVLSEFERYLEKVFEV